MSKMFQFAVSHYITIEQSTRLTLMSDKKMEHEKPFQRFKMIVIFLIIKGTPLHHEKVMVSFQGLTLKSLESTSLFLTME